MIAGVDRVMPDKLLKGIINKILEKALEKEEAP
jgi:hypothetical protein